MGGQALEVVRSVARMGAAEAAAPAVARAGTSAVDTAIRRGISGIANVAAAPAVGLTYLGLPPLAAGIGGVALDAAAIKAAALAADQLSGSRSTRAYGPRPPSGPQAPAPAASSGFSAPTTAGISQEQLAAMRQRQAYAAAQDAYDEEAIRRASQQAQSPRQPYVPPTLG